MRVYIAYGFAEGPKTGRRMRRELKKRRHYMVTDPSVADCVIAHSGGILLLPYRSDTRYLLINPAIVVKHPVKNFFNHIGDDLRNVALKQPGYYFSKTGRNLRYMVTGAETTLSLLRRRGNDSAFKIFTSAQTTIVYTNDSPQGDADEPESKRAKFIDADHDDCWRNPGPYLDLVGL